MAHTHDHAPLPRRRGLAPDHAPDHHHVPGDTHGAARGALLLSLVLTGGFAAVEAVAGVWSGSLALLSDAGQAHARFGYPTVSLRQMLQWVADWVRHEGESYNKPTKFEVRDGRF